MRRKLRLVRTAMRLIALDIRKERKFSGVSYSEAARRVFRKYQVKGQYHRERKSR